MAKPKMTPLAVNEPLTQDDLDALGPPHVPTGPKIINPDAVEEAIYEDQQLQITAKYGEEAANNANYGWGVQVEEDLVGVATKVYGTKDGTMILGSEAGADGIIRHEWTKY